jgi:5-methylthioadenosine/S-adenosylhomocysteine deaminase
MLPTEYLEKVGFLDDRLVAAHCRCMVPSEEEALGRARVSVAFNSTIAARRGLSPRITELEAVGCNIAMGSDNMSEDMVEVLRTGMLMERLRRGDGRHPTPEKALSWATVNGYRALDIKDAGWLAAGNRADLIVLDVEKAHLVPQLRPVSTFSHQGQAGDVESVMVDGQWLMRDRKLMTMDEKKIIRYANDIAQRAWRKLFVDNPSFEVPVGFRN